MEPEINCSEFCDSFPGQVLDRSPFHDLCRTIVSSHWVLEVLGCTCWRGGSGERRKKKNCPCMICIFQLYYWPVKDPSFLTASLYSAPRTAVIPSLRYLPPSWALFGLFSVVDCFWCSSFLPSQFAAGRTGKHTVPSFPSLIARSVSIISGPQALSQHRQAGLPLQRAARWTGPSETLPWSFGSF